MIALVRGEVVASDGGAVVVVTTGGVGYEVQCHEILLEGQDVALHTVHTVSQQDGTQRLWGFRSAADRDLALQLMSVDGVGAASALRLVGELGPQRIITAIVAGSPDDLQVKGLGPAKRGAIVQKLQAWALRQAPVLAKGADRLGDALSLYRTLGGTDDGRLTQLLTEHPQTDIGTLVRRALNPGT